jgi:uncharacterized Zn finger protein (UPF0148 family)
MARYPRAVRDAKITCPECNAPVVEAIDGCFVCVDCGRRIRDGPETSSDGR